MSAVRNRGASGTSDRTAGDAARPDTPILVDDDGLHPSDRRLLRLAEQAERAASAPDDVPEPERDRVGELLDSLSGAGSDGEVGEMGLPGEPGSGAGQAIEGVRETRSTPEVQIHDASGLGSGGGMRYVGSAREIGPDAPAAAQWAAQHVQHALEYFASRGRDGIDGRGGAVEVRVDETSTNAAGEEVHLGNAGYYTVTFQDGSEQEFVRFGRGATQVLPDGRADIRESMVRSYDLTVHELAHGIVKAETGNPGGFKDETGAVHEALADLVAAVATRDWEIGEEIFVPHSDVRLLRDISNPGRPDAFHGLHGHIDQYRAAEAAGRVQEHTSSGILSQAAYRFQAAEGWDALEDLVWDTLEGGQLGDLGFQATADAMRAAAIGRWGEGSSQAASIDRELRQAGL